MKARTPLIPTALLAAGIAFFCNPAPAQQRRAPPDLGLYNGKYPFDRVRGVTFLAHPAVRRAVASAVSDGRIRRMVLGNATSGPIDVGSGFAYAWGCQPHNCPHNWGILVGRRSQASAVCYTPDGSGRAHWYRGGRLFFTEEDSCPHDLANVPQRLLR